MASVDDFLKDTMLAAAGYPPLDEIHSESFPLKQPGKPEDGEDAENVAVWNFDRPEVNGKVCVKNLTCRVNGMNSNMWVCDSIEWGPVTFDSEDLGSAIDLPLNKKFLVRSHFLPQGAINGSAPANRFWKLDANIDQSFELVFGYEFPPFALASVAPAPLSADTLATFADSQAPICVANPSSTSRNTVRVPPLRILVVVTLVCCKERRNFDPGGVLGAGRFYPMIMVVSNKTLKMVTGNVRLTRPEKVHMNMDNCTPEMMQRMFDQEGNIVMQGEHMKPSIGSVLFTDRNPAPQMPFIPEWAQFFDYYDVKPQNGKYVLAYRPSEKPEISPVPDVKVGVRSVNVLPMGSVYLQNSKRRVTKVAGQGEFDNIHMAPRMVFMKDDVSLPWLLKPKMEDLPLDPVIMAPFCIHDCMHLHTRWGRGGRDIQNLGWQDDETPFAKSGAPLVPPNQQVTLEIKAANDIVYTAEAKDVRPAKWQMIMHHGASYALSAPLKALFARFVSADPVVSSGNAPWTAMYWNFRWIVGPDRKVYERLDFDADTLSALRKGAPAETAVPARSAAAAGGE